MKKLTALLMILSLLTSALAFSTAEEGKPEIFTCGDWEYTVQEDDTAVITGYKGSDSQAVVPGELDGISVTGIGKGAFLSCSSLTSITLPDSVTNIREWVFAKCSSLKSVTLPDSMTGIGEWTFFACESLTSITLPDSVTSIGQWAFCGCSSLTNITIPDSVMSIGAEAFYRCSSLTAAVSCDSYAEQYCKDNDIKYVYPDAND